MLGYYHKDFEYDGDESNIVDIAKQEFEKLDKCYTLVSIRREKEIIWGIPVSFLIKYRIQHSLAQVTMWGYKIEFKEYSKYLRQICEDNLIDTEIKDDYIKYFYTNKVASICPKEQDMKIRFASYGLINFLSKVYKGNDVADKYLNDEFKSIVKKKAKVQISDIIKNYPNLDMTKYVIDEDMTGKYIKSDFLKVYILGDKLSKNIQLYRFNDYIGTVKQDEL